MQKPIADAEQRGRTVSAVFATKMKIELTTKHCDPNIANTLKQLTVCNDIERMHSCLKSCIRYQSLHPYRGCIMTLIF